MEADQNKWPISSNDFIQEQAKDSYFRQASSKLGLPGLTFNSERDGFLVRTAPSGGAVQKQVPSLYYHVFYITSFMKHWQGTPVKDVCTTWWEKNIIGHIWQLLLTWLWEIVAQACQRSRQESEDAQYNNSCKVVHWNLSQWTSQDYFRRCDTAAILY